MEEFALKKKIILKLVRDGLGWVRMHWLSFLIPSTSPEFINPSPVLCGGGGTDFWREISWGGGQVVVGTGLESGQK